MSFWQTVLAGYLGAGLFVLTLGAFLVTVGLLLGEGRPITRWAHRRYNRKHGLVSAPSAIPEATESYEAFVERIEADPSTQWGPDQLRPSAVPEARDE
jgi:hypothetical protein